jgi:hypothetical protein
MNPRPGERVWIKNTGGQLPAGTYSGTVIGPSRMLPDWWECEIDGQPVPLLALGRFWEAHKDYMFPRHDPPAVKEQLGEWELCPWRPERTTVNGEVGI